MQKKKDTVKGSAAKLDMSVSEPGNNKYVLRLYVTGTTNRSVLAITNLKRICEEYLGGQYELEVIDLYKMPGLAKDDQIIAAPTLIKKLPLPFRRIIGDMSSEEKVLMGLDLRRIKEL